MMSRVTITKKAADPKVERTISQLKRKFPKIGDIKPIEEFAPRFSDGLWFTQAAEGGEIKGMPAADYYEDYLVGGVHPDLQKELDRLGLYVEWYDPGTLFAYFE